MNREEYISCLLEDAGHCVWLHSERAMTEREHDFDRYLLESLMPPSCDQPVDENDLMVMRAADLLGAYLDTLIESWQN